MAPILPKVFPDFRTFLVSCIIIIPAFLIFQYILKLVYLKLRQIQKLPSGPWGLPLVGYQPLMRKDHHIQFMELSEKYGEVFSLNMGSNAIIVLNSWDSIQEALSRDELLGRPEDLFHSVKNSGKSFPEMSGYAWHDQRKIAQGYLEHEGLYETAVLQEEITKFREKLNETDGLEIMEHLESAINNLLSISLFGHGLTPNDPNQMELEVSLKNLIENFHHHGIRATLGKLGSMLRCETEPDISRSIQCINEFCQREIDTHQNSLNNENQGTDYVFRYLHAMNNRLEINRALDHLTIDTLRSNLLTVLIIGNSTTKSMISWLLIYLVKYPDYQEQLRLEIHQNVGFHSPKPSYGDRFKLPLTRAFIYEVQRLKPILPTGISRKALQDVNIGTESIPRGCTVVFNFYAVHRDEKLWDKPDEFRPERFLTESGFHVTKPSYLMPFSGGKRNCPGESLVGFEVFLFITTILQQFRIKVDEGETVSLAEVSNGVLMPKSVPKFIVEKLE